MKRTMIFVLALAASLAANAEDLYKLVDKNGKITYAEKIPPGFDGKATRVDIDTKRNTATLPKPNVDVESTKTPNVLTRPSAATQAANVREQRIETVKQRLEQAKAELQDAIDNPGEGDIIRMGNVGGGTRPVFSEGYQGRLNALYARVKAAEDALAQAEAN